MQTKLFSDIKQERIGGVFFWSTHQNNSLVIFCIDPQWEMNFAPFPIASGPRYPKDRSHGFPSLRLAAKGPQNSMAWKMTIQMIHFVLGAAIYRRIIP